MYLWMIFILFASAMLELFLASMGVLLPFSHMGGFYFSLVYGWRRCIFPYMAFSVFLELALGRNFPTGLVAGIPVMAGAMIWRRYGNFRERGVQMLPGFCLGIVSASAAMIYSMTVSISAGGRIYAFSPVVPCLQIFGSMLLFPLYCHFLDGIAGRLDFRRYRFVHKYYEEEEEG